MFILHVLFVCSIISVLAGLILTYGPGLYPNDKDLRKAMFPFIWGVCGAMTTLLLMMRRSDLIVGFSFDASLIRGIILFVAGITVWIQYVDIDTENIHGRMFCGVVGISAVVATLPWILLFFSRFL